MLANLGLVDLLIVFIYFGIVFISHDGLPSNENMPGPLQLIISYPEKVKAGL